MSDAFPSIAVTTSTTSGTGALVLATADRTDYLRTPKRAVTQGSLVDGDNVFYHVIDKQVTDGIPTFEVGYGTYDDTANTISRTAGDVIDGSSGPGVLVSLPGSGTRDVLILDHVAVMSALISSSNAFRIAADGKIGIGTSTPDELLQLESTSAAITEVLVTGDAAGAFQVDSNRHTAGDNLGGYNWRWNGTKVGDIRGFAGTDDVNKDEMRMVFRTAEGGVLTEGLVIEQDGDVHIPTNLGIGTNAPSAKLDIKESGAGDTEVNIDGDIGLAKLTLRGAVGVFSINAASALDLLTIEDDAANTPLGIEGGADGNLWLDSNGRVGIGNSSPATNAHVSEGNTDTVPAVEIEQTSTGDAALQLSIVGDAYAIGIDNSDGDKFKISYAAAAGAAVLGTNDRLVIDSTGQVGIKTGSPSTDLQIGSDVSIGSMPPAANTQQAYIAESVNDTTAAANPGVLIGRIQANSAGGVLPLEAYAITNHSSGTMTLSAALVGNNEHRGAGTLSIMRGIAATVFPASGAGPITRLVGGFLLTQNFNASNAVTHMIGLEVDNGGTGGITNAYGVYINTLTGTTKYGIFNQGEDDHNHFAGAIRMPERSNNPPTPTVDAEGIFYVKANRVIFKWNDGGTVRYKYMLLSGTSTTWTHTTTAP